MTTLIKSFPCCHALEYGQEIKPESSNRSEVRAETDYPSRVVEG